jgi:thermitase
VATTTHKSADGASQAFTIARGARGRCLWLAQVSLLLTLFAATTSGAPRFVPGQILVKPKAHLSETNFVGKLRRHGAMNRRTLRHLNVRVAAVSEDKAEAALAALRSDPDIEFAERDYIAEAAFAPNDPYVAAGNAWHLSQIQANQAWDYTTGSSDTVVAVLDSGVNAAHPDLAGRILPGYDLVGNTSDPADDFGHGTAVSGTIVAAGNNDIGVAGVAYGCRVLPVKVLDSSGFATYSCMAQGIKYAVEQGARVINISIAGSSPSSTLQDAVNYAWGSNVVVVAAAGNNANDVPQYPAACQNVMAVSATEPDDSLAWFSSYGNYVTLSAPGNNIWTTQRDLANPYGAWRGTSFASPIVAGVAALVASANPSLSNTQIVSLLEETADDIGPAGGDVSFGSGRINAFRAIAAASSLPGGITPQVTTGPTVNLTSPADSAEFSPGASVPLAASASARAENAAVTHLQRRCAVRVQLDAAPAGQLFVSGCCDG